MATRDIERVLEQGGDAAVYGPNLRLAVEQERFLSKQRATGQVCGCRAKWWKTGLTDRFVPKANILLFIIGITFLAHHTFRLFCHTNKNPL